MLIEPFPKFQFENFNLRQIEPQRDAAHYQQYMSHPQVQEFLADALKVPTIEKAQRDLAYWYTLSNTGQTIYWCIADKISDNMIGTVGFNHVNPAKHDADISYDLGYESWGKGIMRKCINHICNLVHQQLGINTIQATVAKKNLRSISALEKTGFRFSRTILMHEIINGVSCDSYLYIKHM